MKKVISFVISLVLLLCFFSMCACAEGVAETEANAETEEIGESEKNELLEYVQEKIIPVAVGVLTSLTAFLATLTTVLKIVKDLKTTKEELQQASDARETSYLENMEKTEKLIGELKATVADVPQLISSIEELEGKIEALKSETRTSTEILALGFSANEELVKSGKAREMKLMLSKLEKKDGETLEKA